MSDPTVVSQDDRVLAGLAHGSILLGVFTSGIGGIIASLVIWLVQKDKSPYVAYQALQSTVYQTVAWILTMLAWCCWGALWMATLFLPMMANPQAFESSGPPAGFWIGMMLMVVPMGIWGLSILYGLYAAVRCLGGHDFKYAIVGNWLKQ